jgi:peptidoglycan glycosyltransferase
MMDGVLDGTPIEQFPAQGPVDNSKPSGGSYDILNPPKAPPQEPVIVIPPAPPTPKQIEIFPGLSIPVPG